MTVMVSSSRASVRAVLLFGNSDTPSQAGTADDSIRERAALRKAESSARGMCTRRASGKSFHWQGKYSYDLNARETICTDLNVFEFFSPKIPASWRKSEHVFLGNIDPVLQRKVLAQFENPRLVACDTMNFWISGKPEELR